MINTRIYGFLVNVTVEQIHLFFKKIFKSNEFEILIKETTFLSFENELFLIGIDYSSFDRDVNGYYSVMFRVKYKGNKEQAHSFIQETIEILDKLQLKCDIDYQEEDEEGNPLGEEFYISTIH